MSDNTPGIGGTADETRGGTMSTGNNYGGFCPMHHQHFPCPVCLSATPPEGETAIEEFTRLHPAEMAAARANVAVTADYERQIASLKAERDEQIRLNVESHELFDAAEAEVERLREALGKGWTLKQYQFVSQREERRSLSPTNPSGAVASSERKDSDTKH